MSNYYRPAYHPPTQTVRDALWADDYFGRHQYGVLFDGDETAYTPEQVAIPRSRVFVALPDCRKTVADECRAMGLQIGDTIEGTQSGKGWWETARLTLLWLGEQEAVWRMTRQTGASQPQWSEPCESVNWTLSCREWKKRN